MTVAEALHTYRDIESDLLLSHALGTTKEFLLIHPETTIPKTVLKKYTLLCAKRRRGMPIAYLVGYKYFRGIKFKVSSNVLIPRPESEWLVEHAVEHLSVLETKTPERPLKIADVGTGSGCLLIATAAALPEAHLKLHGFDISNKALIVARQNARAQHIRATFKKQDLLGTDTKKYDLIFGNLPYVPAEQYKKLKDGLRHEPKSALTHRNVIMLYQKFLAQAVSCLTPHGQILIEIDPSMKDPLTRWIKKTYTDSVRFSFIKDLNRLWRYGIISFPKYSSQTAVK